MSTASTRTITSTLSRFNPRHFSRAARYTALGLFLFVGTLTVWKFLNIRKAMSGSWSEPPVAVTSLVVKQESWRTTVDVIGSLAAIEGTVLKAEENGRIAKIAFEPGSQVKGGDLLLELDNSVEEAEVKSAEAMAELARLTFERSKKVTQAESMSKQSFDQAQAELKQAEANVVALRARLVRRKIFAPFDGQVGVKLISLGQFVSQGDELLPIYSLNPLLLNFSVPQERAVKLGIGNEVQFRADAYPIETFSGKISAGNPQIDPVTRNISFQAIVDNKDARLRPGMFVRLSVLLADSAEIIAIPASSVSYAPYGDSVFVIEAMKKEDGTEYKGVRQQFVQLGAEKGDQVAVIKGLKSGEEVVTGGVFKLRPNVAVMIDNSLQPSNNPSPVPADI